MDLNKLRTQVFEKTGIKIDTGDPVFALVALNDAVLEESVERHVAKLNEATQKMQEQTTHLLEAGDRVKHLLLQMGQTVEDPIKPQVDKTSPPATLPNTQIPWRMIAAAGGVSLCSCLLVLMGQAAIGLPRGPAPAVIASPQAAPQPGLTPEQITLMQNGEKYAKVWPKLDAKTQEKIKALMQ
jgi:hypothetical protein